LTWNQSVLYSIIKSLLFNISNQNWEVTMTGDKVREVIAIYRKKFEEMGISKKRSSLSSFPNSDNDFLAHCHGMLNEMEIFIQEGRMEKTFRWLGFIQGCLWRAGVYTIDEVKNHNRP